MALSAVAHIPLSHLERTSVAFNNYGISKATWKNTYTSGIFFFTLFNMT